MAKRKHIISFAGSQAIKDQLREWAAKDDRSVSAIVRRAIAREAERRQSKPQKE